MSSVYQGRIVIALCAIPDPRGKNAKPKRPFVVISTPAEIATGGAFFGVAITGYENDESTDVVLPFANFGQYSHTKLTKHSVANCKWIELFERDQVDLSGSAHVPSKCLRDIIMKAAPYLRAKRELLDRSLVDASRESRVSDESDTEANDKGGRFVESD